MTRGGLSFKQPADLAPGTASGMAIRVERQDLKGEILSQGSDQFGFGCHGTS
jgi:hypothetical protein